MRACSTVRRDASDADERVDERVPQSCGGTHAGDTEQTADDRRVDDGGRRCSARRADRDEARSRSCASVRASPSPFMDAAQIQAGLDKLDPRLVSSRTGAPSASQRGKAPGVVRRRVTGPAQCAITHTRDLEYMMVTREPRRS